MSQSNYGTTLLEIVKGVYNRDTISLKNAAYSLETILDSEIVPRSFEYLTTLYAALAYDISNEPFNAKRLYKKLLNQQHNDFSNIVGSEFHSKSLSKAIAHIGLRDYDKFIEQFHEILIHLQNKKEFQTKIVDDEFADDYTVLMTLMNLVGDFFFTIKSLDIEKNKEILYNANKFHQDLFKFDPDSTIEILALMYLELLRSVGERSIISLDISQKIKNTLRDRQVLELWEPQLQAVTQGLLKGNNIVYSSPPGTGKSFLAYVTAGKLEQNQLAVYLVPTKSLSKQVYDDLSNILGVDYKLAISDRDRNNDDDQLNEKNVIVATYEKMDALLRRNKIQENKIQTIIIDEMQYLAEDKRGLTLEFLLTKFREKNIHHSTQLVTLSGLLSRNDSYHLATWLNANLQISDWKGIKTDEMIYYEGRLYHKEGGYSTRAPITPNKHLGKYEQRKLICSYYAKNAIIKSEPVLISVIQRNAVPQLAHELANLMGAYNLLEMDLVGKLQENKKKYHEVIKRIKSIEAELPPFAEDLIKMLEVGVAYHHGGLPAKYRTIIETALRDSEIDVAIATTTLEAGVNFPFKTVILFDPKYNFGQRWQYMKTRTYRNIAGRAGRPGFHRTGEVIVLALSEKELKIYKQKFWGSDVEPIRSSFNLLIDDNKNVELTLQSQLLGLAIANENTSMKSLTRHLESTWFWHQSKKPQDKETVNKKVLDSLKSLEEKNFVKIINSVVIPTQKGIAVNESMFLPLSAHALLKCLEYLFTSDLTEEQIRDFLLVLVGIPIEISNNDKLVEKVVVPESINSLREVFQRIENSNLDPQRLEIALKYGTVLHYWINGMATDKLLASCGLDANSDTAFIEEVLAKDAYWVLSTLNQIADSMETLNNIIVEKIKRIANYCNVGASDDLTCLLLNSGLPYVGRTTAIKLSEFLRMKKISLTSLTEDQFLEIFPTNRETAKLLYKEIKKNSSINEGYF